MITVQYPFTSHACTASSKRSTDPTPAYCSHDHHDSLARALICRRACREHVQGGAPGSAQQAEDPACPWYYARIPTHTRPHTPHVQGYLQVHAIVAQLRSVELMSIPIQLAQLAATSESVVHTPPHVQPHKGEITDTQAIPRYSPGTLLNRCRFPKQRTRTQ